MIVQWGSDFPDAAGNLIPVYLSTNVPPQNNYAFYNNPDVDKILNDSEKEVDQDKRIEMLKQAQRSDLGRSASDLPGTSSSGSSQCRRRSPATPYRHCGIGIRSAAISSLQPAREARRLRALWRATEPSSSMRTELAVSLSPSGLRPGR